MQATDADPPVIHQIALGKVNGVALACQQGSPGASASAVKDGNAYKFTGTATGVDPSQPTTGLVSKPFEVDATCSWPTGEPPYQPGDCFGPCVVGRC